MPIGRRNDESQKTRSHKSRRLKQQNNRYDSNSLTPENILSLRWNNGLIDSILENDRIEQYKELRRKRYVEARQQAIQRLIEQMNMTTMNGSEK